MFEKNDTQEKVSTIISEILKIEKEKITPIATFESLGADSLDRLEIIMKIEETFGIDITDEQEASIKSVNDAIEAIHNRRNK
jgi:acyl carrier protein